MIKNNTDIYPEFFFFQKNKPGLLKDLSESSLQKILEYSSLQNYKKGKILVQQGDTPTYIYFILSGRIKTLRINSDGNEATVRMLEAGDICMEAVTFMGCPSPISVQVLEDAQLMLIPCNFTKRFVLQDHQFATNLLSIVTHHYKNAIHQIDALTTKTPIQRIGYYFLQEHLKQGVNTMEFELPFKKSTVANHLGMTAETFSRALAKIKELGLEIDGEKIRLTDAYSLCHFCDIDSAHHCSAEKMKGCSACPQLSEASH